LKLIQESINNKESIEISLSLSFFIYLVQATSYIYLLFFRPQVLPPLLYESMKTIALFVKQPIANYNEYLDQK
jgi:hypothetical protein